ncbi:MAG: helix-turn-helix domain-containing protein [Kiritimatiellae bacterium]|nr:helix-turn-helix domain-containing protein [Kiritimatiellia bacterium]
MAAEKEYMSLEEVADAMGVTYQLIYRLVRAGELPAARLGKLYRVSRSDLANYLNRSKREATEGGTCANCGTFYLSKGALQQACQKCGAPVCFDCWTRRGVRLCREHGGEG